MKFEEWYLEIYEGELQKDWLQKAFNEGVIEGSKISFPVDKSAKPEIAEIENFGQMLIETEFIEKELQKHYGKQLTMPLIIGLINNIEQYYPADVFVSGAGAMARHVLKLLKQELILACNIDDSRCEH